MVNTVVAMVTNVVMEVQGAVNLRRNAVVTLCVVQRTQIAVRIRNIVVPLVLDAAAKRAVVVRRTTSVAVNTVAQLALTAALMALAVSKPGTGVAEMDFLVQWDFSVAERSVVVQDSSAVDQCVVKTTICVVGTNAAICK